MSELEKRAWFDLAVCTITVFAWIAVFLLVRSAMVASAAFSLLALSAIPELRRARPFFDERDVQISHQSLSVALRILFVACILAPIFAGWIRDGIRW